MSGIAMLAALATSLGALAYLAATDPRRRSALRLDLRERRFARTAWLAALLPGAMLAAAGNGSAFTLWLGAVSLGGWLIAALAPLAAPAWLERLPRYRM